MKKSQIEVPASDGIRLQGDLNHPVGAKALVIFSHGSGSSRFSTRNRHVAEVLNTEKMATLLIDLLTEAEDRVYENRFNIGLLTRRLMEVTSYAGTLQELNNLSIGYFGASTGAASALNAAAQLNGTVQGIVSRGGRPDLARTALPKVLAPTLLIVGSLDTEVIALNEDAFSLLKCEKEMKIIGGASHLFEEPGKLDEVAVLAADWFNKHLLELNPPVF